MAKPHGAKPAPRRASAYALFVSTSRHPLLAVPAALGGALLYALDVPMRALQRLLGVPRIGWMFVAPNLAILALFRFLPIVIKFLFRVHRR